jgi:hypothetical protein
VYVVKDEELLSHGLVSFRYKLIFVFTRMGKKAREKLSTEQGELTSKQALGEWRGP